MIITFNHKICDTINEETGEVYLPKNGSYTKPTSLNDIPSVERPVRNFVQMMNNGVRTGVEGLDYSFWNGCTYEDIDYKKFMAAFSNSIQADVVYSDICDFLSLNFPNIFYYSEMSGSEKGFHFIFYFAVKKTEHIWKMCKSISTFCIKYAFYACGYRNEIDYKGVWDDCANTIYQPCFITKKKGVIYGKCNGDTVSIVNEHKYDIEKTYNRMFNNFIPRESEYKREDWEIVWKREKEVEGYVGYYEHSQRRALFYSLSGLCGDNQELLDSEWNYVANHLEQANGHDTNYYEHVPYRLDWNRTRTGEEYVDKELLKDFGYEIEFKYIGEDNNERKKAKKVNGIRKEKVYL